MFYSNKLNRLIIFLLPFTRFAMLLNFSFYLKLQIYPSIYPSSQFLVISFSFLLSPFLPLFLLELYIFRIPTKRRWNLYGHIVDRGHKTHAVTFLWVVREHAATFWWRNETTRFLIKNLAEKPVAPRRSIPLIFLSFLVSRFSVNRRIFVKFWHEECFAGAERRPRGRLFVLPARNANLPMSHLPLVFPFCILRAMVRRRALTFRFWRSDVDSSDISGPQG